jgi:hypothetical protein
MPRARDWDSLAGSTRERYEKSGIGRTAYESGASLSAARGHATTPEHPGAGAGRPQYQGYYTLRSEITQLKKELFGRVGKWSVTEMKGKTRAHLTKARDYLREMKDNRMSWDEMKLMYPELEADEWDWLGHYH